MTGPRTRFYRDKQNARISGVCSGIADYTGVNVTAVRWAFIIGFFLSQGLMLLFYLVTTWIAPKKPVELYNQDPDEKKFWQGVRANPRRTARAVKSRFREIDRRLAHMEAFHTSTNTRLAQEIEQLR